MSNFSIKKPEEKSLKTKISQPGSKCQPSTGNKLVESSLQIIEESQKSLFNENKYRILAMEEANKTMRKYLKEKEKLNISWLVHHLTTLCETKEETPKKHAFRFEDSIKAAEFNTKLIKYTDYDLDACIKRQKKTILTYGSEFRDTKNLKKLLGYHEDWPEIREILNEGCNYKLGPDPDEETRLSDLKALLKRGNHKSAKRDITVLKKAVSKEVKKGWLLPVTIKSLTKIKGLSIIPLGIANQDTIDEHGNRIPKKRVTHDASFLAPSGLSVNKMVIESQLQECIYGQCLRRIIHVMHQMRFTYKDKRIFMTKYDLDAAYRRIHTTIKHAVKCTTVIEDRAYIALRLPFGVSPGPSVYSTISESIYDLVNDLLNDEDWDRLKLNSPYLKNLPKPEQSDESIPLEQVRELSVYVPDRKMAADGYIDDCLSLSIDEDDLVQKSQEALPLIIHSIFRPKDPEEPIERDDNISEKKLKAEGQPSEIRIMLGWQIDSRRMRISLPSTKAIAWANDIDNILTKNKTNQKELESVIGRLNHVGYILPTGRYFLNRLRHLLTRCKKFGSQNLKEWERNDLILWKQFLKKAETEGISTNNIAFTKVTSYLITDACKHGMGGLNLKSGKAWRFKFPEWMSKKFHINFLEFLASIVSIWLDIIQDNDQTKYKKYLALTDNSSTVGWLYKSNFNPKTHPGHDTLARKLAQVLMNSESTIESQHIKGSHNIVADSLSRDHHIEKTHLAFILKSLFPSQANQNFEILQTLPVEIISWLNSLEDISTTSEALTPKHCKSKTGILFDGKNSWKEVVYTINSLNHSLTKQELPSCQHSSQVLEEMKTARQEKANLPEAPSPPSSTTYVRHFGRTFGGTRH